MNRLPLILAAGAFAAAFAPAAHAADLLLTQPSFDSGYSGAMGGWDGAFVGGFVGYGWGVVEDTGSDVPLPGLSDDQMDASGWLIGANMGANFTVTQGVIVGAVGDIAFSGINGYDSGTDLDVDVNWMGSFRGRVGFDGGAFMPYLTAGLAVAGATADISGNESTQVHFGWTAGAGVEIAATDNLSVDLLYRYSDYGTATYDLGGSGSPDLDLTTHTLSAGLNWKF